MEGTQKKSKKISSPKTSKRKKISSASKKMQPVLDRKTQKKIEQIKKQPSIRVTALPSLSPFVVHLTPAEIPSLFEENHSALIHLDFLVTETNTAHTKISQPDEVLRLRPEEIRQQLEEQDFTPSTLTQVKVRPSSLPTLETIREALRLFRYRQPTKNIPQISASDSFPILLDLPESEGDPDESEIVTWDELTFATHSYSVPEKKPTTPPWKEHFFSLFSKNIRMPVLGLELPIGWHRALAVFVLFSFTFVLPLHAMETWQELRDARKHIEQSSEGALTHLKTAAATIWSGNPAEATPSFSQAKEQFQSARETLETIHGATSFLLSVLPQTKNDYRAAERLLTAGDLLSRAGERMTEGLSSLDKTAEVPTSKLKILSTYLSSALPDLTQAEQEILAVDTKEIPEAYRESLTKLQSLLPSFVGSIQEINDFSDTLAAFLGAEGKKRYLFIFQNNTELRPTGGFMGSFALLDIDRGTVQNLEVPKGGTYDLQGSLRESFIAPKPLQLLNARWEFQDANWFADFPTSARQMLQFYSDAGGPSVDGVVAVNATFVASLLDVLGHLEMPKYERTMTAENFLFETQKIVEQEYPTYQSDSSERTENAPKAFIGDMAATLLERVKNLHKDDFLRLLDRAYAGLQEKDVQLFFTDESLQKTVHSLGWSGEVKNTKGDYLLVVDTNLGGGKTDGVIDEDINLQINVKPDGHIVNTVTISRTHHGIQSALFTGVNNVDYLRIYVPRGSRLLQANGFSIPDSSLFESPDPEWSKDPDLVFSEQTETTDTKNKTIVGEEFGKTYFGNWIQTKPGTTSTATFTYELPFSLNLSGNYESLIEKVKKGLGLQTLKSYQLTIQKQSGVAKRTTELELNLPDEWKIVWRSSETDHPSFSNTTDASYSVLFEPTSL
ncbi:TPA: hypothetical protein DD617_02545 [Candidatus Uhrbacteria bacterium]|nr:hypothetical protein [Candidatus Uhrbacteria bacterium]